MTVFTVGHGVQPIEELVETLAGAGVRTLVDVRRFPSSRRNPQFNQKPLAAAVEAVGIAYRHSEELGGRRSGEPREERFACLRVAAFRSYATRMGTKGWQGVLRSALSEPVPCFLCAETPWSSCHRRLIAELLTAREETVIHLLGPGRLEPHRLYAESEIIDGHLFLCGSLVA